MGIISGSDIISTLVVARPTRSRVFDRLGIDFCCGGKRSLENACREQGLDVARVIAVLVHDDATAEPTEVDLTGMSIAALCDHIESTHHAYLKQELPRLTGLIGTVARVHGATHPWMIEIDSVYQGFAMDLAQHMQKEELILFPAIRALSRGQVACLPCGDSVAAPIAVMLTEHEDAGAALARMHELSHGYTPPASACNTFLAALAGLQELQADMHVHVHTENNVLFERVLASELRAGFCTAERR